MLLAEGAHKLRRLDAFTVVDAEVGLAEMTRRGCKNISTK